LSRKQNNDYFPKITTVYSGRNNPYVFMDTVWGNFSYLPWVVCIFSFFNLQTNPKLLWSRNTHWSIFFNRLNN